MKCLNALCTSAFLVGLLSTVYGQFHIDFDLRPSNTTSTPSVVTIPNENVTSTLNYQSTEFPIGSSTGYTTQPTPNTTTSNTTHTPTNTPTHTPTTSTHTTTMTTTTHNPNHTTTERPTTSPVTPTVPVPTLPPEPVAPSVPWNLTYGSNGTNCMMLSFAARIEITYTNVRNQVVQTGLDVPDKATVDIGKSRCKNGEDKQVFVLDLKSSSVPESELKLTFERHPTEANDSSVYAMEFTVRVTEDLFLGINESYIGKTVVLSAANLSLFDVEPEHSFSCVSLIKTNLVTVKMFDHKFGRAVHMPNSPFQNGTLETSNLKVQAFLPSDQKTDSFLPNTACKQDEGDISSAIPITVGLILLFMVAVVLIAYFIGRSRQQQHNDLE